MGSSKKGFNLQQMKLPRNTTPEQIANDQLCSIADAINSGASWVYNWSTILPDFAFKILNDAGIEFIPTVWSSSLKIEDALAQNAAPKYVFSFNEPDNSGQANMTTTQVIDAYAALADKIPSGSILVGPCISDGAWSFMDTVYQAIKSNGYRMDAFGYHAYRTDLNNFTTTSSTHSIPWMADTYGKPGVVSEAGYTKWSDTWPFSNNRFNDKIVPQMKTFFNWYESSEDVLLYCPFCTHGIEARSANGFNWTGVIGGNYSPLYKMYMGI